MENSDGVTRDEFNAIISDYDLNDTYYPAFKNCVMKGKASSVMCAYPSINGVPSCANEYLLTEVVRNSWGFNGYITSDCNAVRDVYTPYHNYTVNEAQTDSVVFKAGMDLNCGHFVAPQLNESVASGQVDVSDVQRAVYNLVMVQMRLGMFDPPQQIPWKFGGAQYIYHDTYTVLVYVLRSIVQCV